MSNFLNPILTWTFIFTDKSTLLNKCLGKGYLYFLSTKVQFCSSGNLFEDLFCWVWTSLIVIVLSDIIDVYCMYCCLSTCLSSHLICYSDNGITIQIMGYQLFTEVVGFIGLLIVVVIPIERSMTMLKIYGILSNFLIFVIQPLFYLNSDVNFRNRVLHQGLWRALKKELFPFLALTSVTPHIPAERE